MHCGKGKNGCDLKTQIYFGFFDQVKIKKYLNGHFVIP